MTTQKEPVRWSSSWCRLLAGADAAVAGSVLALLWLIFHSWLTGEYWWAKFNVVAAPFFGERVFTAGLGRATLTGASLLLLGFVCVGAAVGRLTPAPPRWYRSLPAAMFASLLLYVVSHRWIWPHVHPFARAYFSPLATLPAHVLFGLMMVRLGRRYLALMVAFGGLEWPPPPPPPVAPDVLSNQDEAPPDLPEEPPVPPESPIVEGVSDPLK